MKLVALLKRRPGMSPDEFREYYESNHAPLALPYLTEAVAYERHYLEPAANPADEAGEPALDFDVITEISFADRGDLDASVQRIRAPEAAALIAADEEKIFDRPATRVFIVDTTCQSPIVAKAD